MDVDHGRVRPEVLAAMTQMPQVVKQVRRVANDIRRDARYLAPKKTGNLRRNIQVERIYDNETGRVHFIVGWGPKAWYGWMVEQGTEDTPPQAHLVPAAIKHMQAAARWLRGESGEL